MTTEIATNRTIELSAIDEDYVMPPKLNVESVVLVPSAEGETIIVREVDEDSLLVKSPAKTVLYSGDGEPRVQYFNQRLRLGFKLTEAVLTATTKVIFNIGELR